MGVLTWLVSDEKKEYCDLGKIFWDEGFVSSLKKVPDPSDKIRDSLVSGAATDDYNHPVPDLEVATKLTVDVVKWMRAHPDWRFLSEVDDEFDDVYLASNDQDAKEYQEEFGAECEPIYKKSGSMWPEPGEVPDGDDD